MDILPFDVLKLHTTPMGEERIIRNLGFTGKVVNVVELCRNLFLDDCATFERRGKNWYIKSGAAIITVNAGSLTIITAHQEGKRK